MELVSGAIVADSLRESKLRLAERVGYYSPGDFVTASGAVFRSAVFRCRVPRAIGNIGNRTLPTTEQPAGAASGRPAHAEAKELLMSSPSSNITSVLKELRTFPPPKDFAAAAHIKSTA